MALNVYLFYIIPKGFFPQQDTGAITGGLQADQSISFQALEKKFTQFVSILQADPAVQNVVGFTGGGSGGGGASNSGFVFIQLKPLAERKVSADAIIARLRGKLKRGGRAAVPAIGAGHPRRRPARQRPVSVFDPGGRPAAARHLGAQDHRARCRK